MKKTHTCTPRHHRRHATRARLVSNKTHHNANGGAGRPRVKHVAKVLREVSEYPTHAPKGEDDDVEEELAELLSLVVHGWLLVDEGGPMTSGEQRAQGGCVCVGGVPGKGLHA